MDFSPDKAIHCRALRLKLPISPLVGEMPGRAEGGAKDRYLSVPADRFEGKTK